VQRRHLEYYGSEPVADEHNEFIDISSEWKPVREEVSDRSDYTSRHTVDYAGNAHDGRFTANSSSLRSKASVRIYVAYFDGEGHDEYVFDRYTDQSSSTDIVVSTTTTETGFYEDLVSDTGAAIRIQAGTYDTRIRTQSSTSSDRTEEGGSAYGPPAPTIISSSEWHTLETEQRKDRIHGWYDPYRGSGEDRTFSRDYELHSRMRADYKATETDWYFKVRNNHDLEIHETEDGASGHGHRYIYVEEDGVVDPYATNTDEDYDPFEGVDLPETPKNPPAKATAVKPREGGGTAPQQTLNGSEYTRWQLANHRELNLPINLFMPSEDAAWAEQLKFSNFKNRLKGSVETWDSLQSAGPSVREVPNTTPKSWFEKTLYLTPVFGDWPRSGYNAFVQDAVLDDIPVKLVWGRFGTGQGGAPLSTVVDVVPASVSDIGAAKKYFDHIAKETNDAYIDAAFEAARLAIAAGTIAFGPTMVAGAQPEAVAVTPNNLLPSPRSSLLNEASDPRLRNAIGNLYRQNAKIGSGSSMDAVRFEKATGQLLSPTGHVQKLLDRRAQLTRLLSDKSLSASDRAVVKRLLIDIQDALSR